ncbi:MAG: leucine-rich repeat-containing protein kinase family protein [Cyanobacteria bacterium P01_F01_bin.56]
MKMLEQLQVQDIPKTKRLNLSCELEQFPREAFDFADCLEVIDLSNNRLSSLPDDFPRLHKLRVLFLNNNQFEGVPEVLSQCPQLSMISFKSNQLATLSETALPPQTRWLILTNNQLTDLPAALGKLTKLQKLMLAGNRLKSLPEELSACHSLELIRIAANQLTAMPQCLFALPRLAWIAYAGNPFCADSWASQRAPTPLEIIDWTKLTIGEQLGQGASGVIYRATWHRHTSVEDVAVKLFKGDITSDGLPADEMKACIAAGTHPNLISVLGRVVNHPEQKAGLVFPFISADYSTLGGPPSLATCTRDTYKPGTQFDIGISLQIARSIAGATAHLHLQGVLHGDLYPHNVLTAPNGNSLLGDFGAAAFFDVEKTPGKNLQQIEGRAFGCLLEDLLRYCPPLDAETHTEVFKALQRMQQACLSPKISDRPSLATLYEALNELTI